MYRTTENQVMEDSASNRMTTRRGFLDFLVGGSLVAWLASLVYPIVRYLKPLPQSGPTGPAHLTRDEISKLEQTQFVIVPVSGERVIVLQLPDQELLAFSAICTHEGCTVTYQPGQSILWCPCHDARFDLNGRVLSGPPPRPLPKYVARRQPDGGIMVVAQKA